MTIIALWGCEVSGHSWEEITQTLRKRRDNITDNFDSSLEGSINESLRHNRDPRESSYLTDAGRISSLTSSLTLCALSLKYV